MFTNPPKLILLVVLMTELASSQGNPTLGSRTARASVAQPAEAASSGPNPASGSDTSASAANTLLIGEQNVESQLGSDKAVGVLTIKPSSVNFENVIVGDRSALPIMLTNTGTASLTISAAAAKGVGFGMSGLSLPLTLKPGNKKSFSADFAPRITGKATGQISLASNASDPHSVIALSGIGVKAHSVTLSWTASISRGVIGYEVFRGGHSGGPYTRLDAALVSETSFKDSAVQAGETYYYVTTAVNSKRIESLYSNQVKVAVPFP